MYPSARVAGRADRLASSRLWPRTKARSSCASGSRHLEGVTRPRATRGTLEPRILRSSVISCVRCASVGIASRIAPTALGTSTCSRKGKAAAKVEAQLIDRPRQQYLEREALFAAAASLVTPVAHHVLADGAYTSPVPRRWRRAAAARARAAPRWSNTLGLACRPDASPPALLRSCARSPRRSPLTAPRYTLRARPRAIPDTAPASSSAPALTALSAPSKRLRATSPAATRPCHLVPPFFYTPPRPPRPSVPPPSAIGRDAPPSALCPLALASPPPLQSTSTTTSWWT